MFKRIYWFIALFFCSTFLCAAAPSVAFFYGANLPTPEIKAFDIVVVEPEHGHDPQAYKTPTSQLFAYISIGEVSGSREYLKDIPANWLFAVNRDWNAKVVDLSIPEWADFVADRIVAPLWAKGYRGFFLDTLDSYRLAKKFDEQSQQAGLVRVIEKLHQRYPDIKLILNRGFDVIPNVKDKVYMVAAESLYGRWMPKDGRYDKVPESDRNWLLGQLLKVKSEYHIPAIAIDYAPPENRTLTRQIASQIKQHGLIPWVSDGHLLSLGIGSVESIPRRILIIYNKADAPSLNLAETHLFLQMPLNHMGYMVDYLDGAAQLPKEPLNDRYAAFILFTTPGPSSRKLTQWVIAKKNEGMRFAIMNDQPLELDRVASRELGIKTSASQPFGNVRITQKHSSIGFESEPLFNTRDISAIQLTDVKALPLIEIIDEKKNRFTGGALTSWGGYIFYPFLIAKQIRTNNDEDVERWVIDPFFFLKAALQLPDTPVPDTTTENGRRMLLAHVDGDGFPTLAQFPGSPLSADVLLKEIFEKYKIPTAMSVIEGEVSPQGLFPKLSPRMEATARKIFSLKYVEIASHSYSHPFLWDLENKHSVFLKGNTEYNLNIPGYIRSNEREILGSKEYIEKRLAPPGKPVKIMLWSGDTSPTGEAIAIATRAGMLNMNGGDTFITKAIPSLRAVGPNGIVKDGQLQVYAPVTNENIYTNLWEGPYYGFERAIETFEMTENPRRLKPVGIYYHTYSASKPAALNALRKVYDWALSRPLLHVYPSEYIRKVQDFYGMSIAKNNNRWEIRGTGELRTLRIPRSLGIPDMRNSMNVAGYSLKGDDYYLHLTDAAAEFEALPEGSIQSVPFLYNANGRITAWQSANHGKELNFSLEAYQKLEFTLANVNNCQVSNNQHPIPVSEKRLVDGIHVQTYKINNVTSTIKISCPGV